MYRAGLYVMVEAGELTLLLPAALVPPGSNWLVAGAFGANAAVVVTAGAGFLCTSQEMTFLGSMGSPCLRGARLIEVGLGTSPVAT